jgi:hypothetical protein
MQQSIVNIAKEMEGNGSIDAHLSFRGFINFLKDRRLHEKTMKVKYLDFVIGHFEHRLKGNEGVAIESVGPYEDLLELVYATIFPAIADEKESLWALSLPMLPVIFYGTDPFFDLLRDPANSKERACLIDKEEKVKKKLNLEVIYSLILKRLYNYTYVPASSVIRSLQDEKTGISHFYRLNIDARFIEVFAKGPLPAIDFTIFRSHRQLSAIVAYLEEHLPLPLFRFEGFSALTVTEITTEYVVDSIKNIILNPAQCGRGGHVEEVIRLLKILAGTSGVDFNLLPFLKLNDKPVFPGAMSGFSVVMSAFNDNPESEKENLSVINEYHLNPRPRLFEKIPEPSGEELFFLKTLRNRGIKSFGMVPVFYNNKPAGVLEVSANEEGILDQTLLSRLDIVIPLLAQLLRQDTEAFEARIGNIIKGNFTSIQPSVEWKFNEVALQYEKKIHSGGIPAILETIYFKDVYPLYGAIDIRNSTLERNSALRLDLQIQFELLTKTLTGLKEKVDLDLLDELIYQSDKWESLLSDSLTTAQELDLNTFLKDRIASFFPISGIAGRIWPT